MGVRIDGTNDKITANDGTLEVQGIHGSYASGNSIAGFSTALAISGIQNHFYKTQESATVAAGTSETIGSNDVNCGRVVFTKLNRIVVGAGATFHVGAGTTLVMNCLGVF